MKLAMTLAAVLALGSTVAFAEDVKVEKNQAPIQMSATEMDSVVAGVDGGNGYGVLTALYFAGSPGAENAGNGILNAWYRSGNYCVGTGQMTQNCY